LSAPERSDLRLSRRLQPLWPFRLRSGRARAASGDPLLGLQELAKRAHNPPADHLARWRAIKEETMGQVRVKVNGRSVSREVEDRTLLVEFLRETLGLTGTHIGCDTGQCGACVIHLDGRAVKSCTMLAAQATGSDIITIEGLAKGDELHPVQAAFREHHALQCGFCTPGMIMTAVDLLNRSPNPDEATIRANLDGNLCRCTGYHNIVKAIAAAAGPYAAMARASQPAE
jgi:aerobic carbon-monoxide dehydrogenase small subunit